MPRNYKRNIGSRVYIAYSAETLQACLEAVRYKRMSQREAADHFKIPKSTIKDKLKGTFFKKPGHQPVFSDVEEMSFVHHIIKLSQYGFPIDEFDLRMIVKSYIVKRGIRIKQFKDECLPGKEWVKSFLNQYKELTTRFASNIKAARASITPQVLNLYLDNLAIELKDIPPENV